MEIKKIRPCTANDKKATFHRWTDRDTVFLQFEVPLKPKGNEEIVKKFREENIIPFGTTPRVIHSTVAIVEFEDGHIEEAEPTSVRFTDVT